MKVHVFTNQRRVYGFTNDATGGNLPVRHGPWIPFKKIKMNRGDKPRIAVNTDHALDDIEDHGYHLVRTTVVRTT